jgi:hypothetical protein
MDDNARITRLAALLAGNGFVLVKLTGFDEQGHIWRSFALVYAAISLLGLAGTYIALACKPAERGAVLGERVGIGALVFFAIVWLVAIASH